MITSRLLRIALLGVSATVLFVPVAIAQLAVATLAGRVTDPQSRPAAGAMVTVRNIGTGATWNAVTGADRCMDDSSSYVSLKTSCFEIV